MSQNYPLEKVGFVGLGAMGESMARNLHQAGLLVAVWNRTHEKAESLGLELGCAAPESLQELAQQCDAVVTCVSADQDVLAVMDEFCKVGGSLQLVIDCSTVAIDTAREAAERLAAIECGFLDAPISGGTEGARLGTLTIMAGGSQADFDRAQPIFAAMGERITRMGDVGSGQATKAVNQVLCAGINQAVCEAVHFAEKLGLPIDDVVDVVGSGAAGNWFINHRGKTMVRGEYPPGFKVALHHKDLKICEAMGYAAGVELPLTEKTRIAYEWLMDNGHAEHDISSLYQLSSASKKAD